ncbi:putative RNA-directed DNA polymerase, eukaryota, reverse transcriptase zinc-binding domain protein [Tanacetum coccineum]|uniref:RNA-directed DNA polymerase, eukaryota, reverse transcriptase zinc-binding domain protein n=1 Tax=Tanacetum coccineum TaxID=301880 RepID=A0ABQ5AT16_9ASTR
MKSSKCSQLEKALEALKNADNFFDANEETSKATNSRDPKDDSDSEVEEVHIDSGNDAIVRKGARTPSNDTDSEVEEMILEEPKGASTPFSSVPDVYVCAILESHVDISALFNVCTKVFRTWDWTSNANLCSKGCRIIVGWNLEVVDVLVVNITSQVMHVKITHKETKREIFCSFVYAANLPIERHKLWSDLDIHKNVVQRKAWVLLGDFNVALNLEDSFSSSSQLTSHMLEFKDCVENIEVMDLSCSGLHYTWNRSLRGIATKLKSLKKPFRKLLHEQGNLHDRVNRLWHELDEVQKALDNNPTDSNVRDEEAIYLKAFNEAKLDEEWFLKQKAKIEWLDVGDSNSAYFHKFVKSRNQRSTSMHCDDLNVDGLFTKTISDEVCSNMVTTVTNLEIKEAMFGTGDDRAPRPDGFTSAFLKKGWDIVGGDICNAVRDFFSNGKLLKEINHTFIALIPKISTPQRVNDYRPISCCNVLYKCISKILTNRIIAGIKEVVSENQSAFVPGRRIADNILITQELMHNYHRDRGPPRCAFKIDIQKAYDTVDWRFLANILKCLGFHPTMIKWIMACIESSSFSISLNGDIHGFFKGKRGLRQGDPLSPYLFTLVMEVLTLIIRRRVRLSETFRYHNHCEELQLVNVCFADDLFIFARGDVDFARVIMESLDEFKSTSGLVSSLPKSTTFFCNVCNHVKIAILNIMPFSEGKLPVKYLGVPLISSKLLIGLVTGRINPYRLFLWCNGEYKRGKTKVAWNQICLPKNKGSLGIRSLETFNKALITTHIWNIVSNKESLWVKWIHTYKLRGRSFWDIPLKADISWGWRKILKLRDTVRPFIKTKIGDGSKTSVWFDSWCDLSPLNRFLTPREITNEGFNMQSKVADLVVNNAWIWPHVWLLKAPNIGTIPSPNLAVHVPDVTRWCDANGNMLEFSVRNVWEALRDCGNEVLWYRLVWFPYCIPHHAFYLWLIMRESLKTQDKVQQWDIGNNDLNLLCCPLCKTQADSHAHLFFECSFSQQVWSLILHLAGIENVPPILHDIVMHLLPLSHKKTTRSIVGRLILAVAAYHVWIERNNQLFKNAKRTPEEIRDMIMVTVRLKLITLRFKNTLSVSRFLEKWKMPCTFRLFGS